MEPREYLTEIKGRLVASAVVASVTVVEEYVLPDRGYLRARLGLSNTDFLEVAEYFVVVAGDYVPRRYRYQWMDSSQTVLKKRWDNVEHFPGLPNFPHHVHVGEESHVEPGIPLSILTLLDMLEQELRSSDLTEGELQ
jgi:hypothetical protein